MAQRSYHCGNLGATVLAYVIQPWVKKVFFFTHFYILENSCR